VLLALSSAGCGGHAQQDRAVVLESAGNSGISTENSGGASSEGGTGTLAVGDSDADKRPHTIELDAFGGPPGKVVANVSSGVPGDEQQGCSTPLTGDACHVTMCPIRGIGLPAAGYGDVGPVSASVGSTTVTLAYNGFGYGTTYFPESVTLAAGGMMTFHGGNVAGVPEFSVSATIPDLAVLTSPVPSADGAAVVIDTSEDLIVNWSPISIGQVRFHLASGGNQIGGTAVTLECSFEGTTGAAVVSRTLLSALKKNSPAGSASAGLTSELEATTVVGGLTITTISHQQPAEPTYDFNVTLE